MIDMEVVEAQLYNNILLCHSYMYSMNAVAPSLLHIMMFPFNGNIITLDQLSYYDPNATTNLENIPPIIGEGKTPRYVDVY